MSFVGWLIAGYIAWAVISALRKAPENRRARHPAQSRAEAQRRLLESLGVLQGERTTVDRMTVPADNTRVRQRPRAAKGDVLADSEVALDHDDDAERVVRQRRREVEKRNRTLAGDDHDAFDARMRREDAAASDAGRRTPDALTELRRLVVWQEILGKPVGSRDR